MNPKRLAAVLRVRELQERGARGEMARRSQAHRIALAAEEHTWAQLHQLSTERGDAARLRVMTAVRDAGMLAAERQHDTTAAADEALTGARAEWTIAARRVEALERLGERLREAEQAEDDRRQILEVDDLVLARRGRGDRP